MTPQEFQELQEEARSLERDIAHAEGQLEQLLQELRDKFDCESLEEGEKLLTEKKQELKRVGEMLDKKIRKFKEQLKRELDRIKGND